jgi:phosphoribosylanthranilate isomerase
MKPLQIKICGMRERENIQLVAALQPDWLGFIFYKPSPRYVGKDFKLPQIQDQIKRVGVFVNENQEVVLEQIRNYRLSAVQLHGKETVADCLSVRNMGVEVIKVFHIDAAFDFKLIDVYKEVADYFLFDTRGKSWGGNAEKFDWQLLDQYEGKTPFLLSGGISISDLEEINKLQHPCLFGVDVNSGVEFSPGIKDIGKVKELISTLRKF